MANHVPRPWITVGVSLLVIALLGLQFVEERSSDDRRVGLYLEEVEERLVAAGVLAGDPAERAGLEAGDVIVSIAGQAVASSLEYDIAARQFAYGRAVEFGVERDGTPLVLEVRPGVAYDWLGFGLNALAVALYLTLAALVFHSGIQGRRVGLLLALLVAIAVELSLPLELVGMPALELWVRPVLWLIVGLQFAVELDLASRIPEPHFLLKRFPGVMLAYYVIGFGWGLLMAASEIPAFGDWLFVAWLSTPSGGVIFEAWYLLWPAGLVGLLSTAAWSADSRLGRRQALIVLAGVAPWIALTGVESLRGLRGLTPSPFLERVEPLVLLFYPLAIFLALYRLQLFDFRVVVKRSLVYSVMATGLVLGFYAIVGGASGFLSSFVEDSSASIWIVVAASMGIGLAIGPLRRLLETRIEHWLFPERVALRHRMSALARDLRRKRELPEISEYLVGALPEIFAVESVALFLKEAPAADLAHQASSHHDAFGLADRPLVPAHADRLLQELGRSGVSILLEDWAGNSAAAARLRSSGARLVQPIVSRRALVGLLLLGRKKGGSAFSSEEIELLGLLSHHVATVFENASLFESATIDGLTGLLRREPILARLETELERVARYRRPLSVALVDLDSFKQVNDLHGHLVGDLMLQRVTDTFASSLRRTDASGRYGGEEFLLVFAETEPEGALGVCEVLRRKVETLAIETDQGATVGVTASIGVASIPAAAPLPVPGLEELLRSADRALYAAKRAGGNRVTSLDGAASQPRRFAG